MSKFVRCASLMMVACMVLSIVSMNVFAMQNDELPAISSHQSEELTAIAFEIAGCAMHVGEDSCIQDSEISGAITRGFGCEICHKSDFVRTGDIPRNMYHGGIHYRHVTSYYICQLEAHVVRIDVSMCCNDTTHVINFY